MAINILDDLIINRISAGEVVESPFSIVKELLDNALDAGATRIVVEIKNGGIDQIIVKDNGKGIDKDDLKNDFTEHRFLMIFLGMIFLGLAVYMFVLGIRALLGIR